MKTNTFKFALKWALIIFGIDLLLSIPSFSSLSGGAANPVWIGFLSFLGMIAKFILFPAAIISYGRATGHKQPPTEMWLFGGLLYLMTTVLSFAASFVPIMLAGDAEGMQGEFDAEGIVALTAGIGLLFSIFILIFSMLIAGQWRTFEKAGKPGWACIVPIYNLIVMAEIGKKPLWWVFMLFIPFVNIVFGIMLINGVSKAFGKDEGWTVGMIFLPFIFYPMLAWGDARYQYGDFEEEDKLYVEDHLVE